MRIRVCGAASVLLTAALGSTAWAQASKPCNRVVSYFLYPYQGSRLNQEEWRIFDPSEGTDTLFLSLPGGFEEVRWDTTFDRVWFSSGDSHYSVEWRLGARPRLSAGSLLHGSASAVTLGDLESESWEGAWRGRAVLIDTSTVAVTGNEGAGIAPDQWFFLGLKAAPRRGVAFKLSGSGAPEHDWFGVTGPLYFVDLDRRTKTLVDGTESGDMRSLFAEHCGFLLIPGAAGNPLIIDSLGLRVSSPPWNSERAVWVPRPRE